MSINRVCISGNLTRDPVLRSTSGGMSVLSMGVAVNDRRKNQQTGQKRSALEVVVDELEFMSGQQQQQGYAPQQYAPQAAPQAPQARTYGQGRPAPAPAPQQPAYAPQPATQQAYAPQQQAMPDLYDEDIPF